MQRDRGGLDPVTSGPAFTTGATLGWTTVTNVVELVSGFTPSWARIVVAKTSADVQVIVVAGAVGSANVQFGLSTTHCVVGVLPGSVTFPFIAIAVLVFPVASGLALTLRPGGMD